MYVRKETKKKGRRKKKLTGDKDEGMCHVRETEQRGVINCFWMEQLKGQRSKSPTGLIYSLRKERRERETKKKESKNNGRQLKQYCTDFTHSGQCLSACENSCVLSSMDCPKLTDCVTVFGCLKDVIVQQVGRVNRKNLLSSCIMGNVGS